jgi:cysteine desulfurase
VEEIARICRAAGVLFHSDGVQAAGKLPVDVRALGVDLYSISGHKLYAPKGVGALYVREGVKLQAQQYGGRHERERRAGTENTAGIVALGTACAWAARHVAPESARLTAWRDRLESAIVERLPLVKVNGGGAPRTPNTLNLSFAGLDGEALVIALDLAGFAVSTGAACSSGATSPSHVLLAMGLSASQARGSLRISLGRLNDETQVEALAAQVVSTVEKLRKLSPAHETS